MEKMVEIRNQAAKLCKSMEAKKAHGIVKENGCKDRFNKIDVDRLNKMDVELEVKSASGLKLFDKIKALKIQGENDNERGSSEKGKKA